MKKPINTESKNHKERLDKRKVEAITFITLLMGFAQSFVLYVMSTYFKISSGSENLGPFYFVAYGVILVLLFNLHKIVKRIGKSNVFYFSLLAKIIIIFLLAIYPPSLFSVFLLMVYIICGNLEWVSLDVILESFSLDNMSGRIRGKHLTFMNAGYLFGPFFSTKVLDSYGYSGVFSVLLIINAVIFVVALMSLRSANHRFKGEVTAKDIIKKVSVRKNILRIYYLSFVLEVFYALTVIYIPIHLADIGYSWEKIGLILTIMLLPFVFLQYPMGLLADKRMGEKELIIVSVFIMSVSSFALFFMMSGTILLWSVVLFSGRVGCAMLEVLRDSYFYKRIDGDDVDLIDFFRTAMPSAFVISSAITLPLLIFFPIKTSFLVVAIITLTGFLPAYFLEDNKCEKELAAMAKGR